MRDFLTNKTCLDFDAENFDLLHYDCPMGKSGPMTVEKTHPLYLSYLSKFEKFRAI